MILCEYYSKCKSMDGFGKHNCRHSHSHDKSEGCSKNECGWLSRQLGYSKEVECTTGALTQFLRKDKLIKINESR